jgi:hypothetical protein
MTGAEWQVILASARPKESQRSPDFKDVFRSAIDNGAAVITMEAS